MSRLEEEGEELADAGLEHVQTFDRRDVEVGDRPMSGQASRMGLVRRDWR